MAPKKPTASQLEGLRRANAARAAKAKAAKQPTAPTIPQRQAALAEAGAKLAG